MFRTISMEEAQATWPEIIDTLVPGEEMLITKDNQTVAKLIRQPTGGSKPPQPGSAKGRLMINVEDDEHLKDFAEYIPAGNGS